MEGAIALIPIEQAQQKSTFRASENKENKMKEKKLLLEKVIKKINHKIEDAIELGLFMIYIESEDFQILKDFGLASILIKSSSNNFWKGPFNPKIYYIQDNDGHYCTCYDSCNNSSECSKRRYTLSWDLKEKDFIQ